jgi:two-component system OmpR family response regulator
LKILIVDDDPHLRLIARWAFERAPGTTVVEADNGATAMTLAALEHPDVILLDVVMPGLDGPSTLRLLKGNERTAQIPVFLLTAKSGRDDLGHTNPGAAAVLEKPFDPLSLAQQVVRMLREAA